jgi:hypothetical protein
MGRLDGQVSDGRKTINLSALNGFILVPPGGILEILNNSGSAITSFTLIETGSVASADANGNLTAHFNLSNFTGRTCWKSKMRSEMRRLLLC